MAYSSTNPARNAVELGFVSGQALHIYESTHDSTQIAAANFFTDCGAGSPSSAAVGMKVGDVLMNVNTATNGISLHRITSLTTSTGWHSPIHATVGAGST